MGAANRKPQTQSQLRAEASGLVYFTLFRVGSKGNQEAGHLLRLPNLMHANVWTRPIPQVEGRMPLPQLRHQLRQGSHARYLHWPLGLALECHRLFGPTATGKPWPLMFLTWGNPLRSRGIHFGL